jgi:hypothetical protein
MGLAHDVALDVVSQTSSESSQESREVELGLTPQSSLTGRPPELI